ncbi:MAG TPA: helix-turn-helix transcriptional regulator [Candidatus Dormibacteraeota bacterium]|jgi:transcriptional regulator with XRE-family HTH domain
MTRTKSDGAAIRELREAQGLGCPQLAQLAGIDRRYLNKIERGLQDGSARTRFRIAVALGVHLSAITYKADSPDAPVEQAA